MSQTYWPAAQRMRIHSSCPWNAATCIGVSPWMSHVTHMHESCHTCQMLPQASVWRSHGTQTSESRHSCEWVMSLTCVSHVTHMNKTCHSYQLVMSPILMGHVTHMNESCHTYYQCHSYQCHSCWWVMSHLECCHMHRRVSMKESWHTNQWVMSLI